MRKYSNNRASRMSDQIQKDIVDILRTKVKDPRIYWVTINEVIVAEDFGVAKVYWTVLDETKREDVEAALAQAKGFIRSVLSQGFKTYTIPQLHFIYDESLIRGTKMLGLLDKVKKEFDPE